MPKNKFLEKINKAIEFQTLEAELTRDESDLEDEIRDFQEELIPRDEVSFCFERIDKQLEELDCYDPDYHRIRKNMTSGNEPGF